MTSEMWMFKRVKRVAEASFLSIMRDKFVVHESVNAEFSLGIETNPHIIDFAR